MNERLQGVEVFVAAVEAGGFARASARLHLTRSAVGKSIARLEARLGQRLFHRTTRQQRLTEEGERYYAHARRALDELDAADSALRESQRSISGRVRITMPELLGRSCVAPLLLALGRQHPGLEFRLLLSDRRYNLIEEGFDLALRSGPLDDSASMAARLVGQQTMGTYASPAYLQSHPWPRSAQALLDDRSQHEFLNYAREDGLQPWRFQDDDERAVVFDAPARFACNSLEVLVQAASDGMGIARLPDWLAAPSVKSGALVRVFDEARPFGYPLQLLWPRVHAMPSRLRLVIDALAKQLPPLIEAQRPAQG